MNFRKVKRGQASIEFLAAFGIIMILFIIFSMIMYQKTIQANDIKRNMAGQRVSNSIAESINSVFIAGQGTSKCVVLPNRVFLDEYWVRFYREEPAVFVYTEQQSWSSPLVTPYINCTLTNICNFSENATTISINSTKDIRLSYKDDNVYIEEC